MSCGFATGVARYVLSLPRSEKNRLFGTWDFKWPKGRRIRIAFQRFPDWANVKAKDRIAYETAIIDKVIEYASQWNRLPAAPLELVFVELQPPVTDRLTARLPAPSQDSLSGKSDLRLLGSHVEYDVLVSLAPLPFNVSYKVKIAEPVGSSKLWHSELRDTEADGKTPLKISLPTSQLGRLALHSDYGAPTVFLGPPARTVTPTPKTFLNGFGSNQRSRAALIDETLQDLRRFLPPRSQSIEEYFGPPKGVSKTEEFESTIVHEFGHVLGMPHLHQSPLARPRWRPLADLRERISNGTGVEVDDTFIKGQLLLPWPATRSRRGDVLFSDWDLPLTDPDTGDPKLESAMTHPLVSFLVADGMPRTSRLTRPTDLDAAFLQNMYV
jgi:hypothetical protein